MDGTNKGCSFYMSRGDVISLRGGSIWCSPLKGDRRGVFSFVEAQENVNLNMVITGGECGRRICSYRSFDKCNSDIRASGL